MWTTEQIQAFEQALRTLEAGFSNLPDVSPPVTTSDMQAVLQLVAARLQENYPYQHPLYLGQMLKPPHPIARMCYALAQCINPNNHALDGGRASSAMELECVEQLATMLGWSTHLGHLCSGGTIANFEALWVARELTSGGVAASSQAHYTHSRLTQVLGRPFHSIPVDRRGKMDLNHLETLLQTKQIGTVVATLGTTGLGSVDPLHELAALQSRYGFRLHVDAAYGGYYGLASTLEPDTRQAFDALGAADSVVIDPHKHGLQPYGCGCVLFRDRQVAAIYAHESPYTYFTSDDLHLGEISLECSRPGAAAVALWGTMKLLPPVPGGEFALSLGRCRDAALQLFQWIERHPRLTPVLAPELDVVVWCVNTSTASEASQAAQRFFNTAAQRDVHLALLSLPQKFVAPLGIIQTWDEPTVQCLRATVMKPEHLYWMPEILNRLERISI